MAFSLNRVQLIGNLGRDPEVRTFQNGNKVANFSVACSESWKDRNTGERKERTEWVNVAVFTPHIVAEIERRFRKGSTVIVEGKLQTRKWQDQSGADRYTTEVVVQGFGPRADLLAPREQQGGQGGGYSGGSSGGGDGGNSGGYGSNGQSSQGGNQSGGGQSDLDDEIPF